MDRREFLQLLAIAADVGEKPLQATKRYKVCGWAPLAQGITGQPIWDVVGRHLRARRSLPPLEVNRPRLIGVNANPEIS